MTNEYKVCHLTVDRARNAIDVQQALDFVQHDDFGGYDVFIGRVRQSNHGRRVTGISYDIFETLAGHQCERIIAVAREQIEPRMSVYLAHAKGRLQVGDVAVVVAVGTPHRDEAFRACRQLIEQVKHECPIWKQEHYIDGDSAWSEGCSLCEAHQTHT